MTKIWSATFQEIPFEVYQYKTSKGGLGYLISASGQAVAIDIIDGPLLVEELEKNHLILSALLLTGYDEDHIEGATYLKEKTECLVIGPPHKEYAFLDQDVADGEENSIGPFSFIVYTMPGCEQDHACYFFSECLALFCGDSMNHSSCKKSLDLPDQLYFEAVQRIKKLPPKTLLFWGHDPQWGEDHSILRSLGEEVLLNPFLRAQTPGEFITLCENSD